MEHDLWRVGLTKFATRMLGDAVDFGLEPHSGDVVGSGQVIGFLEGFKAISDVYCIVDGKFSRVNGALAENVELITKAPYTEGWLYEVVGRIDNRCMDVHGYRELLDQTIDRILEKQKSDEAK